MKKTSLAVAVFLAILGTSAGPLAAAKMYWHGAAVDTSFVTRANLDGSDSEGVVSCSTACGIGEFAIDTLANRIYYDNPGFDRIASANLDGSDEQEVITLDGASVTTMAINVPERKLYWSDFTSIQRLNLDGTNLETLLGGLTGVRGLSIDSLAGKLYWTEASPARLRRADLDGSNAEDLVTGLFLPNGIALDVAGGKMYWTDGLTGVWRADLEGRVEFKPRFRDNVR